jgi:hypothetical protein
MTNQECCLLIDTPEICNAQSPVTAKTLCANVEGGGVGTCQGDSGGIVYGSSTFFECIDVLPSSTILGPLTYQSPTSGIISLVGIVSWSIGTGCAEPEMPAGYARVSEVMCWIYEHVDDYTKSCNPVFDNLDCGTPEDLSDCLWFLDYWGDGKCNDFYNSVQCGFDGGDCCLADNLLNHDQCSTCMCYDNLPTGF